MQDGYIRLYRCLLDNKWSRHPDYVALWVYCLLRGNYRETDVVSKYGTAIHLLPGQFITSREQISLNTGIEQSKVERILKLFKSDQMIEQQNHGKFRVISILNWEKYQAREQQNEQQVNNRRTTGEQQVNTDKKEAKEGKEEKPKTLSSESLRLSGLLADFILTNNPTHKGLSNGSREKTVERWADDIEKMHRLDKRPWADIETVITWSQQDSFWRMNILSGCKLREKYDSLVVKARVTNLPRKREVSL